jgi:Tat protein secretion system quality control protein TatD with DNase activity
MHLFFFYFCSQVLEVLAAIKELEISELAETVFQNTMNVFFNSSQSEDK